MCWFAEEKQDSTMLVPVNLERWVLKARLLINSGSRLYCIANVM